MAKKNDLKNSMSAGLTGGLDSLIQSTAGQKEAQKPKKAKTVHCNFVMDETYHQNLKLIAIRKGDSLKSVLQEAISDYLDKNNCFEGWKTLFSKSNTALIYNKVDFGNEKVEEITIRD